jgi:thymidylate synthase
MIPIAGESVDEVFIKAVTRFAPGLTRDDSGLLKFSPDDAHEAGLYFRTTSDPTSPDRGQDMLEYSVLLEVSNPRDRLIYSKSIDVFNLVGLWVYLLRGSGDIKDIEFYNPVARKFLDEELSVNLLRANWGERLFRTGAVSEIINLLRRSPQTRRAYIPVFSREDIGFESRNLPCLAGIQFSSVDYMLDAFVTMRSQSAIGVLPYDLFLLTMLQEYVATRLGKDVGTYIHFAPIFGMREREATTIDDVSLYEFPVDRTEHMMSPMPILDPGQLALFLDCEKRARQGNENHVMIEQLPDYYKGLLAVTRTRRLFREGDKAWETTFAAAALVLPGPFLKNCYLRLLSTEQNSKMKVN